MKKVRKVEARPCSLPSMWQIQCVPTCAHVRICVMYMCVYVCTHTWGCQGSGSSWADFRWAAGGSLFLSHGRGKRLQPVSLVNISQIETGEYSVFIRKHSLRRARCLPTLDGISHPCPGLFFPWSPLKDPETRSKFDSPDFPVKATSEPSHLQDTSTGPTLPGHPASCTVIHDQISLSLGHLGHEKDCAVPSLPCSHFQLSSALGGIHGC